MGLRIRLLPPSRSRTRAGSARRSLVLDSPDPSGRNENGVPGGTRTPNLLVRSQALYPIELRVRTVNTPKKHGGFYPCFFPDTHNALLAPC